VKTALFFDQAKMLWNRRGLKITMKKISDINEELIAPRGDQGAGKYNGDGRTLSHYQRINQAFQERGGTTKLY